ncbi:hypothetical protein Poli38472_003075 [Pythium oligandrum]|uniref:Uncharacterized protein n=1 Tax=Pythium oligandrum TaxID=41045 RepID=A0A8K1FBD6_PYTOL|nr:hypothetical protein Poli38472_003075 [Pythium oligandrum]|eukprot:TMW57150.1 hypothetical protein Poli38472_003075 [Pythium oligandrum]
MARGLAAKAPMAVFSAILAGTGYAIYYAHNQQREEKQQMRAGVIRDIKRDRMKQRELEQQQTQRQTNE